MCICWLRAHLQAGHESTDRAHCRTEGQCGLQPTLTNRSRSTGENYNLLLSRFVIERLLYRLSVSPHDGGYVLTGAQA
jgi:hypothetical protein